MNAAQSDREQPGDVTIYNIAGTDPLTIPAAELPYLDPLERTRKPWGILDALLPVLAVVLVILAGMAR